MSEYHGLQYEVLGVFKERRDPTGRNVHPSPLDGLAYCQADLIEIGKETQGWPNRVAVAAETGHPEYLALHGNADPAYVAQRLRGSKWKPT